MPEVSDGRALSSDQVYGVLPHSSSGFGIGQKTGNKLSRLNVTKSGSTGFIGSGMRGRKAEILRGGRVLRDSDANELRG